MKNKNWLCSLKLPIVITTLSTSLHALPTLGLTFTYEGKETLKSVQITTDDILGPYSKMNGSVYYYTQFTGRTSDGKYISFRCQPSGKTFMSGEYLPNDRTDPLWIRYATELAPIINSCTDWKYSRESSSYGADLSLVTTVDMWINDGVMWGNGWMSGPRIFKVPVSGVPSIKCNARVKNHMDFGLVPLAGTGGEKAIAYLLVDCNRDSTIHLSVNNGSDLTTEDGSRISFAYQKSSSVSADAPHEIAIEGTIETPPMGAGSHRWYVPIVVSYD
ncbi:hypothetical protein D9A28_16410 [Vibrio cholerae]|nr:hypothetical protein [Vibrio cholerae]